MEQYRSYEKVFKAYDEWQFIAQNYGLRFADDLNKSLAIGHAAGIISLSEQMHTAGIKSTAQSIAESGKRVILLAGPSSSGKTTTAKRIEFQIENLAGIPTLYMGTDDYYRERADVPLGKDGKKNFEDLSSIDIDLFNNNIGALLRGEEVDLPSYDFVEGVKKFGTRLTKIPENELIIIEGIHALNPALTPQIPDEHKFGIYISPLNQLYLDNKDFTRIPTTDVRLIRRMVRDARTRGSDAAHTLSMWDDVRKGEAANIFPFCREADVIFNSSLIYELSALRSRAEKLLLEVPEGGPSAPEAKRLLKFICAFNPLPDESLVPDYSILREFLGETPHG
jgi:uridine kinase